jgi:hypothetical protein
MNDCSCVPSVLSAAEPLLPAMVNMAALLPCMPAAAALCRTALKACKLPGTAVQHCATHAPLHNHHTPPNPCTIITLHPTPAQSSHSTQPPQHHPLCRRIITAMHQRLLFLRNPRFPLPPQVQLMHSGAPHKPVYSYRALGSMAAAGRAAASNVSGSCSRQAGYAAGAATRGATPGAGVFRLDPPEVVFSEYGEQRHVMCCACLCHVAWLVVAMLIHALPIHALLIHRHANVHCRRISCCPCHPQRQAPPTPARFASRT